MDRHTPDRFTAFEQAITDYPEVLECCVVTGQSADYLVKVVVEDMAHYEQFFTRPPDPHTGGVGGSLQLPAAQRCLDNGAATELTANWR